MLRRTILIALVATTATVLWNSTADAYGRPGYQRAYSGYARSSAMMTRPIVVRPMQSVYNRPRCIRGHTVRIPRPYERPRSHAGGTPNMTFYHPSGYYPSNLRPPRQRPCLAI